MNPDTSSLSQRGAKLASGSAKIDMDLFMEAMENLYDPVKKTDGAFPLNVAENKVMSDRILAQLQSILSSHSLPEWVLSYTDPLGHPDAREVMAKFMQDHLCHCPIDPATIGFSSGAAGIIEVSSFVLANPGDVVAIPAPAYPMYTNDLGVKSGMQRYDIQTHLHLQQQGATALLTTELLDEALADIEAQGKCFKLLLLTSPDNPTGCIYTESQLNELANWCIKHQVHLVVNEIYGLSQIDTNDPMLQGDYKSVGSYVSFAKIMAQKQSDYLHLWYALSKDFAMSGMRFGIVHSLNQALMIGFGNVNIPQMVSNITQWAVAELFQDTDFLTGYIAENKKRVTASYRVVIEALRKLEVPYIPARGSLFVWADFSKYLPEDSDQGQEQLWIDIFQQTGVLLTPGAGFQHLKKGVFRIVHSAVPTDHLVVAMDRLVSYFKQTSG